MAMSSVGSPCSRSDLRRPVANAVAASDSRRLSLVPEGFLTAGRGAVLRGAAGGGVGERIAADGAVRSVTAFSLRNSERVVVSLRSSEFRSRRRPSQSIAERRRTRSGETCDWAMPTQAESRARTSWKSRSVRTAPAFWARFSSSSSGVSITQCPSSFEGSCQSPRAARASQIARLASACPVRNPGSRRRRSRGRRGPVPRRRSR